MSEKCSGSSVFQAFYNMLCFTVGAGMLGLPHALLFAGELYVIPVLCGGALCFYTALLLHRAQQHHEVSSYQALGEACGGKRLKLLIACSLSVNQFGIAVLYVITTCQNVELILGGSEAAPRWPLYPLVGAITFIACTRGESIAHISAMSLLGLVSVLAVGGFIVAASTRVEPAASTCAPVAVPQMLAGLGTAIFAYGGHPVYPDIQGSMARPADFGSVIRHAFTLMTLLFLMVMFSSWRAWGCSVHGYVLDDLPNTWWRSAALVGMTVHLVSAIPIVLLPMMRCLEAYLKHEGNSRGVRLAIASLAVVSAYFFPFFTDFVALIGGFTENVLVFVIPLLIHHLTFGCSWSFAGLAEMALQGTILTLAAAIFTVGTASSLGNIFAKWDQYHVRWFLF